MKQTVLSLLFSCFLGFISFAQSADEIEVAMRVEALRKVMVTPDKSILEDLAAEELSYGHSSGMIEDKAAFIDEFVKGRTVITSLSFLDQTIKIAGNTAIVRHKLIADTNKNNQPGKLDILILLIWQKQNEQWKLLARQAAKIPEPVKP